MLTQTTAVTGLNLKSIPERWAASLVIVVGLAGVVAVFTALLAMAEGFQSTLKSTGRTDVAMVLRGGSDAELNSGLLRDATTLIKQAPGVRKDDDGQPLAAAEMIVIAELIRKDDVKNGANITVRGVEPKSLKLRPQLKIVEGRMFETGKRELIVGRAVTRQFEGARVGQTLRMRGSDWTVVGVFESGDANESELWCDVEVAQTTFNRQGFSSVRAVLDNPDALKAFKDALSTDPRLSVDVQTEQDYYSGQTRQFRQQIGFLAGVVTLIMALGAIFAALNTMYAAVAARGKEIATLRAIGFSGASVVTSIIVESLVLALVGGAIGAAVAYLLFNNFSVSTLGQNFTQVVFAFKVTPQLVFFGLLIAMSVGLIGGVFPAVRPSGPFLARVAILGVALTTVFAVEVGIFVAVARGSVVTAAIVFISVGVASAVLAAIGYALTTVVLRLRASGRLQSVPLKLLLTVVLFPFAGLLGLFFFGWPCLYAIWTSSGEVTVDPMLANLRAA